MVQISKTSSAAKRLTPFLALVGFYALAVLSGCGGGGNNDGNNTGGTTGGGTTGGVSPSPTASVPVDAGRGGALSDACNKQGNYIAQNGWTANCGVPVQPKRKWTVLLYMNGANDLEEYGTLNLNQIEQFGSDNNVTFVAQFKRIKSNASYDDTSDGDWTGARRFVVRRDSDMNHVSSPIVASRADIDMGNPQTLKEFVSWGVQTFPAERYAIVLWNHGAGWRSQEITRSAKTRGFSYDDEKGTHIDTIEVPDAIDLGSGRKWDLVAWDSSLMQMAEVAYEIRNKTNWIVGSEESPPGRGYPYHLWVDKLIANPSADGRFVGEAICDAMLAGYGASSNITESLIDASKMDALTAAINNFGTALTAAKGTYGTQIASARDMSEEFDYYSNKDLLDFTRLVKEGVSDGNVQNTANAVQSAASAAIVKSVNGNSHPNAKGIAIYIPTPSAYRRDDIDQANGFGQRYTELNFAKAAPNWQSFIANGPN